MPRRRQAPVVPATNPRNPMSVINTEIKPFRATAYQNGEFIEVTDADLKGKWSVVVFYPADFTFVCPTELEDLAVNYDEFKKLGVEIRSEEHTSELQSLMRISYAVFCLKKKN